MKLHEPGSASEKNVAVGATCTDAGYGIISLPAGKRLKVKSFVQSIFRLRILCGSCRAET